MPRVRSGKVASRWSLSLGIFHFRSENLFLWKTPPIFFWLGIYAFFYWRWTWVRDSEGLHEVLVSDEMTSCTAWIFKNIHRCRVFLGGPGSEMICIDIQKTRQWTQFPQHILQWWGLQGVDSHFFSMTALTKALPPRTLTVRPWKVTETQ